MPRMPPFDVNYDMTNKDWIDFLSCQFNVSRTTAREMLHVLMILKCKDNFKKQLQERGI